MWWTNNYILDFLQLFHFLIHHKSLHCRKPSLIINNNSARGRGSATAWSLSKSHALSILCLLGTFQMTMNDNCAAAIVALHTFIDYCCKSKGRHTGHHRSRHDKNGVTRRHVHILFFHDHKKAFCALWRK